MSSRLVTTVSAMASTMVPALALLAATPARAETPATAPEA
jgi:hypothetical protein